MELSEKTKDFWNKNHKWLTIVIVCVLAVCFIGNVLWSIFSGGEFSTVSKTAEVMGLLRLNESSYITDYLTGDTFSFDKEKTDITLIAKDPAIDHVVKIENLPASEYGFSINGEGDIYDKAEEITLNADVKSVSVVSKYYPNLKVDIPVTVVSTEGVEFKDSLLLEAEKAKLYKDNVLLQAEEKLVQPNEDKPFLSSAGNTVEGADCSGGACLRNFTTNNMKVQFDIVCTEDAEVVLTIKYCKRPDGKTFGNYYKVKVNGKENSAIASLQTGAGEAGTYFTPADLETVTLTLTRGINTITFESGDTAGTKNPCNLDAILLTSTAKVMGVVA